jgi:hypothetical protein
MRRLAVLALIAALVPASALAQHDGGVSVKPRPMHVVEQPAPRRITPMPWAVEAPPPAVLSATPQAPAADPRRCGMYCAQTYYFCLSRDQGEDCGSDWSQCRAACSPSAAPDWRGVR